MGETRYFAEYSSGTAPLVLRSAESRPAISEYVAGVAAILVVSAETRRFSEKSTIIVSNLLVSRESRSFSEYSRGTVTIKGSSRETVKRRREKTSSILHIWSHESRRSTEYVRGFVPIYGSSSETRRRPVDHSYILVIALESGEIWCINLATGGHSRYTGAVDGTAPVDAYVLTNVDQLGSDKEKYVPEVFLHGRFAGDVELTTITDEEYEAGPYHLECDVKAGIHRRRIPLAKGIKGMNWQFKVSNVNGSDITLKSLEVPALPTKRTQ